MVSSVLGKIFILLVVMAAAVVGVFAWRSYQEAQQLRQQLNELQANPQASSQAELQQVIDAVGQLMVLPEAETPTLATITDRDKLQEVPFFTRAENGDKVLLYVNARRAILFRPSTNKIIEVATLNLAKTTPTPAGTPGAITSVGPVPTALP